MVGRKLEVLEGPQYTLIPLREEHISDRYIGWLNDPEVNRYLEVRFARQTYETTLAYVRSFYGDIEKYMWGVHANGGTVLVGTATLSSIQRHHGSGVIGQMIGDRAYWGKGASRATMALIVQFAFETLGLRRLIGSTNASDHATNFTMVNLGFTCEGKMRQANVMGPGKYADTYYWGLLREDRSAGDVTGPGGAGGWAS